MTEQDATSNRQPQQPNGQIDGREKILNAALKMFIEKGLSVSTASITKAAGVSTGLLYHYYKTKEDLVADLYADALDGFYQVIPRTVAFTADNGVGIMEAIRNQVEESWDWCLDNWEKFLFMELVGSASLAHQVYPFASEQPRMRREQALELLGKIRDRAPVRNLPNELILELMTSNIKQIAFYLHDHPDMRHDPQFREEAWKHYRSSIMED